MPKTVKKQKGNRFEKVRFQIPYYTTSFFEPNKEAEDGEVTVPMVKLPIKIYANGDESRSNVTNFELKSITHFDNNVEIVLEVLTQLREKVIKPKAIDNPNEEWKVTLQLLQIVCADTAVATLQETSRVARTQVYDDHFDDNGDDDIQKEVLTSDDASIFAYMETEWEDLGDEFEDSAAYTRFLFAEYKRAFFNHLNSIIFGPDAYRAFKNQKDYMLHKIVKPYGTPVEAAFRRIEVLAKYLESFPPPSSRGKLATAAQWKSFEDSKKLSEDIKREMKYNLLPESYHDRFDNNEQDWTEMSNSKFLAEAQKFEIADTKDRLKMEQQREKLKRKQPTDTESVSSLNRAQKDKNGSNKKRKPDSKPTYVAKQCELCKMAGKPTFIYTTHNTADCKFRDTYAKAMNSNSNSNRREKPSNKEYHRSENDFRREIKLLQRQVKKLTSRSKKRGRDDSASVSSMESDDASY